MFAWGLMVPLLIYFLGPQLQAFLPAGARTKPAGTAMANAVWRYIVRPIAVGGMLVGAAYTLFRMRKNLSAGLGRAFAELQAAAAAEERRTHRALHELEDGVRLDRRHLRLMVFLYVYLSGKCWAAIVAAIVMLMAGFFFATVSGYLVGFIGSSNNPISGLTLSTADHRGAADGGARRVRHNRRRGDPRGGGRGLRLVRGRRRAAAGLQGRLHPRRHAAHHSDRRADRRRRARAS